MTWKTNKGVVVVFRCNLSSHMVKSISKWWVFHSISLIGAYTPTFVRYLIGQRNDHYCTYPATISGQNSESPSFIQSVSVEFLGVSIGYPPSWMLHSWRKRWCPAWFLPIGWIIPFTVTGTPHKLNDGHFSIPRSQHIPSNMVISLLSTAGPLGARHPADCHWIPAVFPWMDGFWWSGWWLWAGQIAIIFTLDMIHSLIQNPMWNIGCHWSEGLIRTNLEYTIRDLSSTTHGSD